MVTRVKTSNITDGTILNADISSSAAITGNKINIASGNDGTSITLAATDKILVDDGGTTKYVNASQIDDFVGAIALAIALG
tara:strand:- start:179 stop:421 length:243 start_codon:yes stop_codon:yes gene_type:complete